MDGFPGLEPLNLGGAFNTGLSWKELILYAAGATVVVTGIGGVLCGAKSHSQLTSSVPKSMDPDLQTVMAGSMGSRNTRSQDANRSKGISSSDFNKLLEEILSRAVLLQKQGDHLASAEMFVTAAGLVPPQYGVQLHSSALQEFVAAGRYDLARDHLENIPPIGAENEALIAHELQLARFSLHLEDSKALEYLSNAESIAEVLPSSDNYLFMINKLRGEYYIKTRDFEKAEAILRSIIEEKVEIHKQNGSSDLPKDVTGAFCELQRVFISQGKPNIAMDILNKEIKPLTSTSYDDIAYYWHLTHLAYIFIEYDYSQFAEQVWNEVLEMYESSYEELKEKTHAERTTFDERVLSIVTNTKNEMSVMYYNQGKLNKFKELQKELMEKRYRLFTTSKYFDTTNIDFLFSSDDSDCVVYQVILELKIRNPSMLSPYSKFKLIVEENGIKKEEGIEEYDPQSSTVTLRSKERNELEKDSIFTLYVEVCDDNQDDEEEQFDAYSHIQSTYSKYDVPPNLPFSKFRSLQ